MSPLPIFSCPPPVVESFAALRACLLAELGAVRPITSADARVIDWMLSNQQITASQLLGALRSTDQQVRDAALARLDFPAGGAS